MQDILPKFQTMHLTKCFKCFYWVPKDTTLKGTTLIRRYVWLLRGNKYSLETI